ncbi:EthD domain-containing protein [Bacillus sp. B15-48]|uniref:EthD domain-containing protein n=1 Tax=Bacillus sp. B15-48 TaxID=1548601 RepID=UPI00193EC6C6|nr:EthD domain-containing protein [Bacillus sp. B15-48]MBM4761817.1 EthD family reductase [Bacillus sp. B15-48]
MIKVSTILMKNHNISIQEFHNHWQNEHAKIAMSTPSWYQYMRKYVQSHTYHALHKDKQPPFDGVAHFWLDHIESFKEWTQLPELSVVAEDTRKLVDGKKLIRLFTNELEQYALPDWKQRSKIKRISFIKKSPKMKIDEFHDYWANHHSLLVMERPWWKYCNRYVQNHIQYDAYPNGESPLGYNGFAEIYFDDLQAFERWQDGHVNDEVVVADEKKMVGHVDTFFTYEIQIQP